MARLTYSNVVSTLALFTALGGSAYAATRISGRQIENGTITAQKLKAHTLTGKQLDLRKLGAVPSARNAVTARTAVTATTAATAKNAQQLGGVPASSYALAGSTSSFSPLTLQSAATKTMFQSGPFTFTANCQPGSYQYGTTLNGWISVTAAVGWRFEVNGYETVQTPGSIGTIVQGTSTNGTSGTGLGDFAVAADDGTVVSGALWAEASESANSCVFAGHAQIGG